MQGRFLFGLLHALTVHGLVRIETFVQSGLFLVGKNGGCDWGIRRAHDGTGMDGGRGSCRIQVQRHSGCAPDIA